MTSAAPAVALRAPRPSGLAWGLVAFICLLPVHSLVIAVLFGAFGWPGPTVRVIAAWKEMLIAALAALTALRVLLGRGHRTGVQWLDLVVAGLGGLALAYLIGANLWFDLGLPIGAQLYGFRDAAFVSLLYFVGRATPAVVETPRFLRALFIVGIVTSALA